MSTRIRAPRARAARRVEWPEVLRALPDPETRSYALQILRDRGFSPAFFDERNEVRLGVSEALTRTEDWLEMRRATRRLEALRTGIQAVRRRLEDEQP